MSEFTIGCDPEIFLIDADGNPVAAPGVIPGDKKNPHKVTSGAIQVDGTAVEFNTDPVNYLDFAAFNRNVVRVLKELELKVKEHNPGLKFKIAPVQDFTKEYMDSLPDSAKELGCDPDYSAYTLQPNPMPDGDRLFRTGAGHLHVGWGADIPVDNEDHIKICSDFVKMLDATVGLFMTFIDREPRRRELYGKAGAFRPKPYGVEYRTPSNVWLTTKYRRAVVFRLIRNAISALRQGHDVESYLRHKEEDIRRIIDEGDHAAAWAIIRSRLSSSDEMYYFTSSADCKALLAK